MARRKNPSLSDVISSTVLGTVVNKAKDHVVGYYAKKAKRKRKNPEELIDIRTTTPSHHSKDMLPASDVAELVGGEYIPLKGMIISDDSIQLITNAGEKVSNPGKRRLATLLGRKSGRSHGVTGRTILKNPRVTKAQIATPLIYEAARRARKSKLNFEAAFADYWFYDAPNSVKQAYSKSDTKRLFKSIFNRDIQ